MHRILIQFTAFFFFALNPSDAQTLTGKITDTFGFPVANARVTLFSGDTIQFWESRTDMTGQYLFKNLPSGGPYLFLGVAARGFNYFNRANILIMGAVVFDVVVKPETQPGVWKTILDSPEPLGGTDLGMLLPNGNIFYCHDTKDPFAFDPLLNDTLSVLGDKQVQGCVAPKLIWNGKIIMAGGTAQETYGPGTRKIKQYNFFTDTWQELPLMLDYRWYPSMTQLADGRLLITGGGGLKNPIRVNTTELYDPNTGKTEWADTIAKPNEQSPILTLYNGKALMTHRPPQLFEPITKKWELAADFVQGNRMPNGDHADHELVHLSDGEVIAIGFKPFPAGKSGNLIERYDPVNNVWRVGAHFAPLRSRPKTVLLPDHRILTLAGEKEDPIDPSPVNQWNYMDIADIYEPASDTWRRLARMPRKREYHALAILVPDGRVIVVGGEGQPGNEPTKSVIDAFEPPYLFRGVRPQVLNLEKTDYQRGDTIRFEVRHTNGPTDIILQSTQAVTHMMNCGENRFLDLDFTQQGQLIEALIPDDSLRALPGWYLLWAMVDDIPSVARIIRILPGKPVITATKEPTVVSAFRVFPNPVELNGLLTIKILLNRTGKFNFELTDAMGRNIRNFSFFEKTNEAQVFVLKTTGVPSGTYFLTARLGREILGTQKVILE